MVRMLHRCVFFIINKKHTQELDGKSQVTPILQQEVTQYSILWWHRHSIPTEKVISSLQITKYLSHDILYWVQQRGLPVYTHDKVNIAMTQ